MEITNNKTANNERDYALVSAVLQGNQFAYTKLMDIYFNAVYFTIYKLIANKNDAEDLTLIAFTKAYTGLSTYSPEYPFSSWVFRIAVNSYIDQLRKQKSPLISFDNTNVGNDFSNVFIDVNPNPEQELIQKQNANRLKTTIEELKPLWQKLIEMRYYQELSYDEISEELNIPLGTIKNQLHRAKAKLAKLYFDKIQ